MSRPTPVSRRTLLVDLGRATLGAVLLGGVAAGCSDDEGATADPTSTPPSDGAPPEGASDDGPQATPAAGGRPWQRASFGFVSAYVLVRDGEALVFDTGTGDDIGPLNGALQAAGVGWDAVGHVLVSHDHGDHVGGVDLVAAEAPGAAVYGAMPDLGDIRDRVPDAMEVVDGDTVMGLRVIATPGHTLGHVSALDEATGLLLVGDALVNDVAIGGASGEGIELSPPEFTTDAEAAADSGRALADLTFEVALFGHGEPITSGADAAVAAAVA